MFWSHNITILSPRSIGEKRWYCSISQTNGMLKNYEVRWKQENTNFYFFPCEGSYGYESITKHPKMEVQYKVNYWKLNTILKDSVGFSFSLENDRLGFPSLGPPFPFIFMTLKKKYFFMGNLCWSPCSGAYTYWNWVCLSILVEPYMDGHITQGYIPNPQVQDTHTSTPYPVTLGLGTHTLAT